MANSQTLVFRVDASVAMGTGHVMRCLALAQVWQDAGGDVVFAMARSTPAVEERLRLEGVEIVHLKTSASAQDAAPVADLARARQASWVVVDGYDFDAEYQRHFKNSGLKVLFVDDNGHAAHYFADIVLNQNAHASEDLYASRETYTRLLLGPSYAMLRREFRPWRHWEREIAPIGHKVLVMMGGSDPNNITGRVINALRLATVERLETTVVVGGSNSQAEFLTKAADQPGAFRFVRNVSNMPELMAWADVAVSAAGTTAWELAFMGLPSLLLVVAEHQSPVAEALAMNAAGINLGDSSDMEDQDIAAIAGDLLRNATKRKQMSENGTRLVDGVGARRVTEALRGNCGLAESARQ
jgi:UDP-2,4-diacetamido-2,4,6-trideoxy-beta-L-altropyranose hydrolase